MFSHSAVCYEIIHKYFLFRVNSSKFIALNESISGDKAVLNVKRSYIRFRTFIDGLVQKIDDGSEREKVMIVELIGSVDRSNVFFVGSTHGTAHDIFAR